MRQEGAKPFPGSDIFINFAEEYKTCTWDAGQAEKDAEDSCNTPALSPVAQCSCKDSAFVSDLQLVTLDMLLVTLCPPQSPPPPQSPQ